MSSLTDALGPKVSNLGQMIGLITRDGGVNEQWFQNAGTEIGNIPRQVPELLQLIQDVLGPATETPDLPGGSWYSIPNPVDGVTPTNFYLLAPPPPDENSQPPYAAQVGLGVMHERGYGSLSIVAYGFVPLFQLSSDPGPTLLVGTAASSVGVALGMTGGSTFSAPDGITFESLKLDVEIYFSSSQSPAMQLVFGGLKGAPVSVPDEYNSFAQQFRWANDIFDPHEFGSPISCGHFKLLGNANEPPHFGKTRKNCGSLRSSVGRKFHRIDQSVMVGSKCGHLNGDELRLTG